MSVAVPWFPVVGAVLGAVLGLSYLGLVEVVASPLAALVVVGLGAVLTGAFHEDGLADTFDSFGGYTPARRLEIMRDSRIGTFGTLALVVATGTKVVALSSLDGLDGLGALVAAHTFGRAASLVVMRLGPEARVDGLAATSAALRSRWLVAAVAVAAIVAAALGPTTAVVLGVLVLLVFASTRFARHQFGGTTGDVLGAVEQLGEIAALVVVSEMVVTQGWLWI